MTSLHEMQLKSIEYRRMILTMIKRSGTGHTAGSLSCVDILNVLYNRAMNISPDNFASPHRNRYIHSKGHSVEALYAVLADCGFFAVEELETFSRYQSRLVGHPTRKVPGIEQNTGALGHGLSVAVGLALAAKKDGHADRVFTLLGDGELAEGSSWEASLSAAHYKLDNLIVIIDRNGLQITGQTEKVMQLESLAEKFTAFGYAVKRVNGNNIVDLAQTFDNLPFVPGKPNLVLAQTVKGHGISFMENQAKWHHKVPSDAEFAQAMQELDAARANLINTSETEMEVTRVPQ